MAIDLRVGAIPADGSELRYHVITESLGDHVIWCQDVNQHLDLCLTDPAVAAMVERLGRFGLTNVLLQPRGIGISDPVGRPPTVEEQAEDILAVMDAERISRATLIGTGAHCAAPALVAARHPGRVQGLILLGATAIGAQVDDTACGWTPETSRDCVACYERAFAAWGDGLTLTAWDRGLCSPRNLRLIGMAERCSASVELAAAWYRRHFAFDAREIYRQVRVPTLVLSVPNSAYGERTAAALAELIPGAEHRALPPSGFGDSLGDAWVTISEETARMAIGARAATVDDRALTTVLFTDIVGSTDHLARIGDAAWAAVLDEHERQAIRAAAHEGGRVVNTAGDGMLCELPGPAAAVRCAHALQAALAPQGIELRAGVHTGECQRRGPELAGLAVHAGARIGALAEAGEVLLSEAATDLAAGGELDFVSRGEHTLKGVPGTWRVFAVSALPQAVPAPTAPRPTPADRVALAISRRVPRATRAVNRAADDLQRRRARRSGLRAAEADGGA